MREQDALRVSSVILLMEQVFPGSRVYDRNFRQTSVLLSAILWRWTRQCQCVIASCL